MVVVQNVSKLYRLYNRPSDRLAELLPFHSSRHRDFWAVQDVSFSRSRASASLPVALALSRDSNRTSERWIGWRLPAQYISQRHGFGSGARLLTTTE